MSHQYETIIKDNRPYLGHSSIRTYCSILFNLQKKVGSKDILDKENIIKLSDAIMKALADVEPKKRKTTLAACVVVLDDKKDSKALDEFRSLMNSDSKAADEQANKQELTDKERDNWLPWDKILDVYHDLEKRVTPILKLKDLTPQMKRLVQQYLILSCFTQIKPRRSSDWINFKLRNIDKSKDNYADGSKLVFNSYKTSKYLGKQEVDFNLKLKKIIIKWNQINKGEWLLYDTKGNHMTASQFTQELYDIFQRRISTNMLRHAYLTHLLGSVDLEKMMKVAEEMGQTDLLTQMRYVRKDAPKEEEAKEEPKEEPKEEIVKIKSSRNSKKPKNAKKA